MRLLRNLIIILIILSASYALYLHFDKPKIENKKYVNEQSKLPKITIDENNIIIENFRNFTYASDTKAKFDTLKLKQNEIKSAYYVVVPFKGPDAAHTFLTYETNDGKYISVSVEARKEEGETYDPLLGLFNHYELMYVIGSAKDIIGSRLNKQDKIYLYKLNLSRDELNHLFLAQLNRAKTLKDNIEYYNTFFNSCMSNVINDLNSVKKLNYIFDYRKYLPKNSDAMLYEDNMLEVKGSSDELKGRYHIYDLNLDYSKEDFLKNINY